MVISMSTWTLTGYVAFLFLFGSFCIFFPKKIQYLASKAVDMGITFKSTKLKTYIESSLYIFNLRLIGFIAYVMGFLMAYGLYLRITR